MESVHVHLINVNISRVPDQNGVSQARNIVEMYHSGQEPLICTLSRRVLLGEVCCCCCFLFFCVVVFVWLVGGFFSLLGLVNRNYFHTLV